MKRATVNWLVILSVMIWVTFGMTVFKVGQESSPMNGLLASTSMAALVHAEGKLNQTASGKDSDCFIVREHVGPSGTYSLFDKQPLPVWGNRITAGHSLSIGFFRPAMVLLLFSRFYQSSRTSSEEDPRPIFAV